MSELFTGDGQSPLGDVSGTSELAPPILYPTPIKGATDFDNTGGVGTKAGRLSLRGAGNAAMGGHVRLVQEVNGADPYIGGSVITARRTRVGSFGTHTDLDQSFSRSWTDPLVDVGAGELRVLDDDPDLSGFHFDGNDVIQFLLNGQLAYTIIVEEPVRVAISTDEEVGEGWKLGGRGHLSLLERALVYPSGGVGRKPAQEDRIFNWTDPDYDDAGWIAGKIITYILWVIQAPYGAGGPWGGFTDGPWDVNFSDPTARIMWSSDGTINNAQVGRVYGRQRFYMSAADDHAYFQGEADNACDYFLNGQLILSTTDWKTRNDADISIPQGWNVLGTLCENRGPIPSSNPAGWAWACWDYGYPPTLYAHSDESVRILPFPATVPSMPVGRVMRIAIEEAQARGALPYITLAFTDTHDSAGKPWPTPEISTKVGTDLLTFFSKEIGETYIDLYMPPGSTQLYAWNKRGRGHSSGLTLAGSTDNTFFDTVRHRWYPDVAGDHFYPFDYQIEISNTGDSWVPTKYVTGNTSIDVTDTITPTDARYVRIVVTNRQADFSTYAQLALREFTIDGVSPVAASSPDTVYSGDVPAFAIDGSLATFWQPVAGTHYGTIEFDRGAPTGDVGNLTALEHVVVP